MGDKLFALLYLRCLSNTEVLRRGQWVHTLRRGTRHHLVNLLTIRSLLRASSGQIYLGREARQPFPQDGRSGDNSQRSERLSGSFSVGVVRERPPTSAPSRAAFTRRLKSGPRERRRKLSPCTGLGSRGPQDSGRAARGRQRSRPAPQGHQGQRAHARPAKSVSRGARGGASRLSSQTESLTGRHVVLVLLRAGEVFGVEFLHVTASQGAPS